MCKGGLSMSLPERKKSFGLVQIKKRSIITLGAELRKELRLNEGDVLDVSVEEGKIILEPKKLIPADQQWYWSEEWQAGEREAREDIATGRVIRANSVEELIEKLNCDNHDEV